jgi:hypothetical protein
MKKKLFACILAFILVFASGAAIYANVDLNDVQETNITEPIAINGCAAPTPPPTGGGGCCCTRPIKIQQDTPCDN